MSNSSGKPWSSNPYAPQITYKEYFAEKANFAGCLIGAILYGIVIVLFFRCLSALLSTTERSRGGVRWGFVAHTAAMFSLVTIYTAINLEIQSISNIDNREFPGTDVMPPGPFGYELFISSTAIGVVPTIMFQLNTWLADGLLLYRCCVTYTMNYWVVALPCLMYLASLATGIAFIYQSFQPTFVIITSSGTQISFGTPYYSISLSLNVLLTIMIVTRILSHQRNTGSSLRTGGIYKAVINMLIESCALYAVSYILFIGPWASGSSVSNIFFPILAETQVIAPFLIILRAANQRASLSSGVIVAGKASSLHFGSQGRSKGGNVTLPDVCLTSSMGSNVKIPCEIGIGTEVTIHSHHDKV